MRSRAGLRPGFSAEVHLQGRNPVFFVSGSNSSYDKQAGHKATLLFPEGSEWSSLSPVLASELAAFWFAGHVVSRLCCPGHMTPG